VTAAFLAGFLSHLSYQWWTAPSLLDLDHHLERQSYPVTFIPPNPEAQEPESTPVVQASDLRRMREFAGRQARVRGRVYKVGHSAQSNTYFLDFGPSRSAFTGVIFSSAAEIFQRRKIHPIHYEGREVELIGEIRDHPQYGLEMILEDPSAIKVLK
jgi:hypothetical protein